MFTIGSITTEQVLQAVELVVAMHANGDDAVAVDIPGYIDQNVSVKVVKLFRVIPE